MRNDTSRYDEAFNTFMVTPVDMEALRKEADEMFRKDGYLKDDESVLLGTFAIFAGTDGVKRLIDTECIEQSLSIRLMVKGPNYINTDPGFGITMSSIDEFKTLNPVSLHDFMGDRYGYNSRILSNMSAWMDIIQ